MCIFFPCCLPKNRKMSISKYFSRAVSIKNCLKRKTKTAAACIKSETTTLQAHSTELSQPALKGIHDFKPWGQSGTYLWGQSIWLPHRIQQYPIQNVTVRNPIPHYSITHYNYKIYKQLSSI